jgi:hypothetical protein
LDIPLDNDESTTIIKSSPTTEDDIKEDDVEMTWEAIASKTGLLVEEDQFWNRCVLSLKSESRQYTDITSQRLLINLRSG